MAGGLAHVNHTNDRHFFVVGAVRHFQQAVFALLHVVKAFHRRRGGAEHDHGVFHPPAHDGDVARLVARGLLLFVGMLVFLVHDDQAQRVHRRENGGARADDDAGAALANLVPFVVAFAGGQMAVQHRHEGLAGAAGEARLETLDRLRGQGNLRHQDNGAPAVLQGVRRWPANKLPSCRCR